MTDTLPTFAELFAISDIHLGGSKSDAGNFQIFDQGQRLAGFVDLVSVQRPNEEIALVLNGDIIDTLAEDAVTGYVALDERTALGVVDRLWRDASFSMVWDALTRYLAKAKRHLIIVVGNHDIELALPVVEADLRRRLAGADHERQSRLVFSTHGAGFACRVGRARVFCTHGNEIDPMNWVNYNLLGQLANALNSGRDGNPELWKPNGGTRLVRDVMNIVKKEYPFVDLLKPETAAIAAVLMAIDRETFRRVDLSDALPIAMAARRGSAVTDRLMGGDATSLASAIAAGPTAPAARLEQWLGPNLREAVRESRRSASSEDDLLRQAGDAMARGDRTAGAADPSGATDTLGWREVVAGGLGLMPKKKALRLALRDWVAGDPTYDVNAADADFTKMQSRVADTVDFTITGHTHLARALTLPNGRHYYNCGTWIRLLRLTTQVLDDEAAFEQRLWPVLNARSMAALDNAVIPGPNGDQPLLLDRTNAVRLSANAQGTVGELLRVTGSARDKVAWAREDGTAQANASA